MYCIGSTNTQTIILSYIVLPINITQTKFLKDGVSMWQGLTSRLHWDACSASLLVAGCEQCTGQVKQAVQLFNSLRDY